MVAGGGGSIDRRSLLLQVGMIVMAAVLLFLVPSIPGWHGNPERHSLYLLTLPGLRGAPGALRGGHLPQPAHPPRGAHRRPQRARGRCEHGLVVLAGATMATALVSEILVHSLDAFGHALGLSQFFVAAVIVAIVGNAAEHGGAVVIARRGNPRLGAEIAISSATQVAVFVAPAIALLSVFIGRGLPLSFRPVELAAMGGAGIVVAITVADGRSKRWEGFLLLGLYAAVVVAFGFSGDR